MALPLLFYRVYGDRSRHRRFFTHSEKPIIESFPSLSNQKYVAGIDELNGNYRYQRVFAKYREALHYTRIAESLPSHPQSTPPIFPHHTALCRQPAGDRHVLVWIGFWLSGFTGLFFWFSVFGNA